MAQITRVHGDVLSGVNQNATVGELVTFGGSKTKCFKILVKDSASIAVDISDEVQSGEAVETIVFEILKISSLLFLQIENDTSGQISIMIEHDGGGWDHVTLQQTLRQLGTTCGVNNIDVSGTTVEDVGFKLA